MKTFGEGKDLNYELQVDSLPEIKLKSFENFKASEFKIKIEKKIIDDKLKEIASQHKTFSEKKEGEKAENGNQITFDYTATVEGKKFEGSEGKGVQIELGKDLFIKGFDQQLLGVKKNDLKTIETKLPENHPKKELANKKTIFDCKIVNIKKPEETKIDENFAKQMGAKNLDDLKILIEKQISSQYNQALDSITKKEILDQINKSHELELPKNLVDQELLTMTQNLKESEREKHKKENEKLASSRIKLGLLLNEYGEKNKIKITDEEVQLEINKQIKGMPGQEKMIIDYYQKNPTATQSIKGALYEEKIINLLKSKMKLTSNQISIKEAEKLINDFNTPKDSSKESKKDSSKESKKVKTSTKTKTKTKK